MLEGVAGRRGGRGRTALKMAAPVAVIGACYALLALVPRDRLGSTERLLDLAQQLGAWGPLLLVLSLMLRPLLLLPGSPFTAVAGMLWGAVLGTGLSLAGSALSALVVITIGQRLLSRLLLRWVRVDRELLAEVARRHDFVYALVFALTPIGQDVSLLLAAGAGARRSRLVFGSVLGNVPGTIAVAMFGEALARGRPLMIALTVLCWIASSFGAILLARRIWSALAPVRRRRGAPG